MVSNIQNLSSSFQVGGTLAKDNLLYVERKADYELYSNLKQGEFCYVFSPRQMGKSSLRLRVKHRLESEGYCCASVDLTMIGGEHLTPAQWYFGFICELWRSFRLGKKLNLKDWWEKLGDLPPVQKLSQFIEDILFEYIEGNFFIFVDEIDTVKSLNFSTDDFFAFIRFCYNQRGYNQEYNRLNWSLFGVTTISDLIINNSRTPFNIGKAIELTGFKCPEVTPLIEGLKGKVNNPHGTIKEILYWTKGQPFLTQKLCKIFADKSCFLFDNKIDPIRQSVNSNNSYLSQLINEFLNYHSEVKIQVENVVKCLIIDNWQINDHPEHLKTISNRLLLCKNKDKLLKLYKKILKQENIVNYDHPEIMQLLLSGIIIKYDEKIIVNNPIYEQVFNLDWVESQLSSVNQKELCKKCLDIMQEMNNKDWEILGKTIAKTYPHQYQKLLEVIQSNL